MDTGANGHNKRRRVDNRVYVGSSDLGFRREHMEVAVKRFVASVLDCSNSKSVIRCAQVEAAVHNGLYRDMDIVQELWEHAFK